MNAVGTEAAARTAMSSAASLRMFTAISPRTLHDTRCPLKGASNRVSKSGVVSITGEFSDGWAVLAGYTF